jgi:hypothetical protein
MVITLTISEFVLLVLLPEFFEYMIRTSIRVYTYQVPSIFVQAFKQY